MKRKIKLLSTVASLVLVFVIMSFTAWAAQSVSISISNNVSYSVSASVKATISATTEAGDNTEIKSGGDDKSIEFLGDEKEGEYDGDLDLGNVILEAISIAAGKTIIFSYTITITNNATVHDTIKNLNVTFNAPLERPFVVGDFGVSITYGGTYTAEGHTNTSTLTPGQTHTMTVTFEGDANVSHDTTGTGILNSSVQLEVNGD